jgi:hypothetical protein
MRSDMKYVVIERGRRGGRGKHHRTRPRREGEEWEGYLKHEGMRLPYGYNTKIQTDLLGPLWGYLRKHVGRPWDVVYADICRSLDFRTVLGFHIKSHLFDGFGGVERHVEMRGRVPYERVGRFGSPPAPVNGFYVHPRTGLLLDTRSAVTRNGRASKPALPATRKILDDWTQLHWIHGAWSRSRWRCTTALFPMATPYSVSCAMLAPSSLVFTTALECMRRESVNFRGRKRNDTDSSHRTAVWPNGHENHHRPDGERRGRSASPPPPFHRTPPRTQLPARHFRRVRRLPRPHVRVTRRTRAPFLPHVAQIIVDGSGGVRDDLQFLASIDALQDVVDVSKHGVFDQILGTVSTLEDR